VRTETTYCPVVAGVNVSSGFLSAPLRLSFEATTTPAGSNTSRYRSGGVVPRPMADHVTAVSAWSDAVQRSRCPAASTPREARAS
jgi:hypothetical protein